MPYLLSILIWLPIAAGLAILLLGDRQIRAGRWLALLASLATLVLTVPLWGEFNTGTAALQFVEKLPWIPRFQAYYALGIDGIALPLIVLTAFMTVPVVIAGWTVIEARPAQYYAAFLIMEGLMIGVFSASDALLFYFFWEAMLIPMFLIIGIWGGPRRVYATIKFFLYTFLGSVFIFAWMHVLPEQAADELHLLYDDVTRVFERPFNVDGHEIAARVKSGFACYPQDGTEPSQLVQNAEAALKEAKSSGERYLHHRLEMNSERARRVGMENRLRTALEERQFVLHYQPKIELRTGRVTGVEALLRWQDPECGLVAPATFLPMLESAGLMPATGAWVLQQAADDCREWRRKGLRPLRVAVNISPPELARRTLVGEILACAGDFARDPSWGIDIEITEGALSGDSSSCIHSLRLLRSAGIRIAIDDFGTGFSSLGRLSELPIDTLKIDRVFTSRLPSDRKSCTLVSTIIGLARAFDLTTVAEGVENRPQLDHLIREGCDESQGYLHSRPLPRAELEAWLARSAGLTAPTAELSGVGA